ncbi:MAG: hypothetical protein ACI4CS_05845 [Candidatus Weimeria sp.]
MGDLIVILVLAFFAVLAAVAIFRDMKSGNPTCGYVCGDEVCRGRCGHVSTEKMSRATRKDVKETVKELRKMQKKHS